MLEHIFIVIQNFGRLQFLFSLEEFVRAIQNGVHEVCGICSSEDIVQPVFNGEVFNVKYLLISAK